MFDWTGGPSGRIDPRVYDEISQEIDTGSDGHIADAARVAAAAVHLLTTWGFSERLPRRSEIKPAHRPGPAASAASDANASDATDDDVRRLDH